MKAQQIHFPEQSRHLLSFHFSQTIIMFCQILICSKCTFLVYVLYPFVYYFCILYFMYLYLRYIVPACLPACFPTYLPTYLCTYLCTYLSTYLHTYVRTYLPTCLPACLPAYLWNFKLFYLRLSMIAFSFVRKPVFTLK